MNNSRIDLNTRVPATALTLVSIRTTFYRTQRLQPSEENWNLSGNVQVWRCHSSWSNTNLAKYAQYQASDFQESLTVRKLCCFCFWTFYSPLFLCHSHHLFCVMFCRQLQLTSSLQQPQSSNRNNASPVSTNGPSTSDVTSLQQKERKFKTIKFGTNIDLSSKKKWRPQLNELNKLPWLFRVSSRSCLCWLSL